MIPVTWRIATLMGSASFLTLTSVIAAHAQQQTVENQVAQAAPEQVLVTGSLIHGATAVGVPVTNLGAQDLTVTGSVSIGDLFRTVPAANVSPGPSAVLNGGHQERETHVNIRGLDAHGPRSLLMVDGTRFPPQADGLCSIDPSIIPALALDRVDVLVDGASATYGSDAIAGVINVLLKRGFDGAVTLLHASTPTDGGGGQQFQASQLYGRTWDGGDITLTYEWTDERRILGTVHSKYTVNYTPWGLDNEIPIGASMPGTISVSAPVFPPGINSLGTSCSNCWAIPHGTGVSFNPGSNGLGPTAASSGATLNWPAFAIPANLGTNEIDPMKQGWEQAAQQHNSAVVTFDQRLFPGVSFFATGFYSNRRVEELMSPDSTLGVTNDIKTFAVPTTNPYYPTNAPSNLRVSYDFAHEVPPTIPAYEISARYQFGLNLDLPFGWTGQIYESRSYEANKYAVTEVNDNAVSVALGNTVGGVSKPASLPYMNLFCDPAVLECNSPTTLAYITATRLLGDQYSLEEKGARFDGPLFDLPGGQIKAAVGGTYESDNVLLFNANNAGTAAGSPLIPVTDPEPFTVWAGFAQIDVPVFGQNFNLPLVRKLEFEASWRHDQYASPNGALAGGTGNPKLAFTWLIDELTGATVRGSWGTSFRFANAGEYSTVGSDASGVTNLAGTSGQVPLPCTAGTPVAGSAAAALFAAGFACNSLPVGITWSGAPEPALRSYVNAAGQVTSREGGIALAPEKAINYSAGFELAPQIAFLRGLDLQATWYSVKINGTLSGSSASTTQVLANPSQRFQVIVPSDLGCPVAANANPASCAPFETMAAAALLDRNSVQPLSILTNISWINDAGTINQGFLHVEGIDWNASYDFDAGDFGAWNTGVTGTYYLHNFQQTVNGGAVTDALHGNITAAGGIPQNGVETTPRMLYRARLGWSNGEYSVTGFVNYISHYFAPLAVPPNVNLECTTAGGNTGGGTFPCAISNYTNIEPPWYTFDLSFGYNTGDRPAGDYLKNITIQLTVQNLMGIHPAFEYNATSRGTNLSAYDTLKPDTGRVVGITLRKNW